MAPVPDSFTYNDVPAPPAVFEYSDPGGPETVPFGLPLPVTHVIDPIPIELVAFTVVPLTDPAECTFVAINPAI